MATQKQVCDIRPSKSFTTAQSNEHLRVAHEGAYSRNMSNNFDPTREHLNFEVQDGKVIPVNKSKSIPKRIKENIEARGIENPNRGIPQSELDKKNVGRRIIANLIIGGSRNQMHRLAYGDQEVNMKHGSDNSSITRQKEIEKWAVDMYNYIANKFGKQNIAAFIVHLDEKNPHVHCTLLPITTTKTGQEKFSWRKIWVGENNDKYEYSQRMIDLHDELAEINTKYGLERGTPVKQTGAKHRSTEEYNEELKEENMQLEVKNESSRQELHNRNKEIKQARKRLKGLTKMLTNLEAKKEMLTREIQALQQQRDAGRISVEDYNKEKGILESNIKQLNEKISQRHAQIFDANTTLNSLLHKIAFQEDRQQEVVSQLKKSLPTLHQQRLQEGRAIFQKLTAEDVKDNFNKIQHFRSSLSPEQQTEFDTIFDSEKNNLGALIENQTDEVVAVAAALFQGYMEQAQALAQNHGGGGSGPSSGWGRDKNDDDESWWRKCMAMSRKMMGKQSISPSKKKGKHL